MMGAGRMGNRMGMGNDEDDTDDEEDTDDEDEDDMGRMMMGGGRGDRLAGVAMIERGTTTTFPTFSPRARG